LLLVAATGTCGILVWMLALLVLIVAGLLALATLAVEHRLAGAADFPHHP
jgi:hypothetical protein